MIAAAGPVVAIAPTTFGMIDQLLRDRDAIVARIAAGKDLAAIVRTMTATIAVAMAIVGAALGAYRGGVQIGYAAIKLPVAMLGTAALSAPALTAIGAALGRRVRLAEDLALVITALAFGSLLLVSCAPLILVAEAFEVSYHRMTLLAVALCSCAGIASLRVVIGAVARERAPGGKTAIAGLCVVFALVGGQLAWALRPYLVRPRAPEAPFLRTVEDSLVDALTGAFDSARGIYSREFAPLPGEDAP